MCVCVELGVRVRVSSDDEVMGRKSMGLNRAEDGERGCCKTSLNV